jgi:hypothetical protein
MSEQRDDELSEQLARVRKVASIGITVALMAATWVIMAFIVNHNQANSIRDLQRRMATLEQRLSRPSARLPEVGEVHWCIDCAAGDPCGQGSGAWLGRLENGKLICSR